MTWSPEVKAESDKLANACVHFARHEGLQPPPVIPADRDVVRRARQLIVNLRREGKISQCHVNWALELLKPIGEVK